MSTSPLPSSVPQDLITRRQAAEILGVSLKTVIRLTATGSLPAWCTGRYIWVSKAEVQKCSVKRTTPVPYIPKGKQQA